MKEDKEIKNIFLPIGTVVKLKDEEKRVMIIGFCSMSKKNKKIYHYVACLYPEGVIDTEKLIMFDNVEIEKIVYRGFNNKESNKFASGLIKFNGILKNIDEFAIKEASKLKNNNESDVK